MDLATRNMIIGAVLTGIFVLAAQAINPIIADMLKKDTNNPPTIVDFDSDLLSPQPRDADIFWSATALDSDNDELYYKFQLKGPDTDGRWEDQKNWSKRNSWTWSPNRRDIGTNTIRVLVRDNKHVLSDVVGDVNAKSDPYIITKSSHDWENEASADLNRGEYETALNASDKAIELDPDNANAWTIKATSLLYTRRPDEALKASNKAVELNTGDTVAWIIKGMSLMYLGYFNESIQSFNKAVKLDSSLAPTFEDLINKMNFIRSRKNDSWLAEEIRHMPYPW